MAAIKVANLCRLCKENEVKPARRKRKFSDCVDCRFDKARQIRKERVVHRQLQNHINRVVRYYDCGWRTGYLILLKRRAACVQPIGPIGARPDEVYPLLTDIELSESVKYPTIQDWAKYAGWKEATVKPILLLRTPKSVTPVGVTTPEQVVASIMEGVVAAAKPVPVALENGTEEPWSPARAVELYQGGMKVSDIAAHFGDRNKQNRVRKACKDAGVYQGK